jgi:hypothetical protein
MMQMVYEIRLEVPTEMDALADSSVAVLAAAHMPAPFSVSR